MNKNDNNTGDGKGLGEVPSAVDPGLAVSVFVRMLHIAKLHISHSVDRNSLIIVINTQQSDPAEQEMLKRDLVAIFSQVTEVRERIRREELGGGG